MTDFNRESVLDPYVLIAQEKLRELAIQICKTGLEDKHGEYVVDASPATIFDVENGLISMGLGELAVVDSEYLDDQARTSTIELYARYDEFQMFVQDKVKSYSPASDIPINDETAWSATVGLVVPYIGTNRDGDTYLNDHVITVIADSSDELPIVSSFLEFNIQGDYINEGTESLQHGKSLTTEQSLAYVAMLSKFYNRSQFGK